MRVIDAYIHLDKYNKAEKDALLNCLNENNIEGLISVSMDLVSCQENLKLALGNPRIYPAFGFHPEQPLPSDEELVELVKWIEGNQASMVAVGEVGLPYYSRAEKAGAAFPYERYVELLEQFIVLAKKLDKPIVLHAVYDDAPVVCGLLEKHNAGKAHFHWFKGDEMTIGRMIANGYHVSFTPDILYEEETRAVVKQYPLGLMMAETDGPWPFEGIFLGKKTHPKMVHHVVSEIAAIKKMRVEEVYNNLLQNSKRFYGI
ncbi:TatD family hydrolase [Bacillus sp. B-jedd]|uniref:TatD family hydrolase n=1 Tax=Bacillus sp. B-jedd TaxID=1476857 RepID=UPI0005156301|nr:TatD family hydrolase [Bacillus sp. B-jedd]CEG26206.1 Mg-dependent deoxyribonuclease [Bacillus sp. B-jedd]